MAQEKVGWERRIGRRLRLRDLHMFSMVVECGSMAKAAAELRVAQPTVSEVIANLENAYGVQLFDRSPRGVEPTVYGRALLKRSVAVFDEIKQSGRDIRVSDRPHGRRIAHWLRRVPVGHDSPAAHIAVFTTVPRRDCPRRRFDGSRDGFSGLT